MEKEQPDKKERPAAKKAEGELLILERQYDLVLWYVQAISKFSRDRRRVLGDRLEAHLYGLLEGMIEARYSRNKLPLLYQLNTRLDMLRFETRLAHDLKALGPKQYEHVSGRIDEIGRLLGGWIRQQRGNG